MKRLRSNSRALALCVGALALAQAGSAQSNSIPGTNVELGVLGNLSALGRQGTFPNGVNGLAMSTTSCNNGSVNVPWLAAMQENHPFIAFLIVRETDGVLRQISDRSHVKHGFFALSNSQCTPCQVPSNGSFLGIGCSDTYDTSNNGDNYWLGPADEVDPWLGTWTAACSYFDVGDPPAPPSQQCDGNRSLTGGQAFQLGPVGHRINVTDAELNTPGTFWYQGQYVIRGEPLANRHDNLVSRRFVPTWSGSSWSTSEPSGQLDGSVLQRWSALDAIDFASNGANDGRVWVAVSTEETSPGTWHYEYAVHNVDNARGFDGVHVPLAPGATISNFTFHDIDADAGNDWSANQRADELAVGHAANALRWNVIYNFGFDSNAGPAQAVVSLDQALPGAGLDHVDVTVLAPLAGDGPLFYCSPKPSSAGCISTLTTSNPLANAVSGAGNYAVIGQDIQGFKNGLAFYGISGPAAIPFGGGTLCVNPPTARGPLQNSGGTSSLSCDGQLSLTVNTGVSIPFGPDAGPGNTAWYQIWYRDPLNGAGEDGIALTNAVELDFL